MDDLVREIKAYIKAGVYDQNEIFNRIYPSFTRHYSVLRETIAKVKNDVLR